MGRPSSTGTSLRGRPALRCRRCGRSGSAPSSPPSRSSAGPSCCAAPSTAARASGGSSSTDPPAGKTTVVCIPELEAACRALAAADDGLALTIEPAGATYERVVADPTSAPEVWVTLDPWPQMVSSAVAVSGADDPFPDGGRRGLSDLVDGRPDAPDGRVAGPLRGTIDVALRRRRRRRSRGTSLGGEAAWGCSSRAMPTPPSLPSGSCRSPRSSPTTGAPTDYTGTDLQNDDAFLSWLGRLEGAIPTYGDAVEHPAVDHAVAAPASTWSARPRPRSAKAGAQAGRSDGALPGRHRAPQAQVVVAGGDHAQAVWTSAALRDGLDASAGTRRRRAAPRAPAGTGLPPPDVMIALRDLWQGVAKR